MDLEAFGRLWQMLGPLVGVGVGVGSVFLAGLINRKNAAWVQKQAWQRDYNARQVESLRVLLDKADKLHSAEAHFGITDESPYSSMLKAAKTQLIGDFLGLPASAFRALSEESLEDAYKVIFDLHLRQMSRDEWSECWDRVYSEVEGIITGETI